MNTEKLATEEFIEKTARNNVQKDLPLDAIYDVPVKVNVVIGRTKMPINRLLQLRCGDVVELDSKIGETVDILVNDKTVAKGELVASDDKLAVTVTDIAQK